MINIKVQFFIIVDNTITTNIITIIVFTNLINKFQSFELIWLLMQRNCYYFINNNNNNGYF